jgi:hypothetical protein
VPVQRFHSLSRQQPVSGIVADWRVRPLGRVLADSENERFRLPLLDGDSAALLPKAQRSPETGSKENQARRRFELREEPSRFTLDGERGNGLKI